MSAAPVGASAKQLRGIASATGRVNIFGGSVRSGKSFSWTWILLQKVSKAGPVGAIVVVGKNRDSIYRNVFEPIESNPAFAIFAPHVHYRQGAATATVFGRTVHIVGANDAKSEAKIRGMTIQYAFCDEVTVLDSNFFKQLLSRMSVDGAQLFGTTNPDSPAHWLKRDYLDRLKELPDWKYFHFTIDDNPILSTAYKESLRREYTGLWHRRFILGQWVAADGAVYDMWTPSKHIVRWQDLPPMKDILTLGIDYGTTNATSAIMLGAGLDGVLYAIDEWRYAPTNDSTRHTDAQLSKGIIDWMGGPHLPPDRLDMTFVHQTELDMRKRERRDNVNLRCPRVAVDPAAASFRVQMREDGVTTYPAENDVLYGIRLVASLLAMGRLKVSDRCTGLITEVPGYSWDAKISEKGEDKPLKVADHSLDAFRYSVTTSERLWRRWINPNTRPNEPEKSLAA